MSRSSSPKEVALTKQQQWHHPLYSLILEAARLRVEIAAAEVEQAKADTYLKAAQTRASRASGAVLAPTGRLGQTEAIIEQLLKRDQMNRDVIIARWRAEAEKEAAK